MDEFTKQGYLVIKNLLPGELTTRALVEIKRKLSEAAEEIDVSASDYLNCTGRWVTSSPITTTASNLLHSYVEAQVQNLFQNKLVFKKSSIICKSGTGSDILPFHQDISYSFGDPYSVSLWLPLVDVDENSAPLKILVGSHTWKVEPLVDFWNPSFIDSHAESPLAISLPVSAGDGILFDSRLWHGTGKNTSGQDRFVYATRWGIQDEIIPIVPSPKDSSFGIMNCGSNTERILRKYLHLLDPKYYTETLTLEEITRIYVHRLETEPDFCNFLVASNRRKAQLDVQRLQILNQASRLHLACDVSGRTYRELWTSLLVHLDREI